MRSLFPKDRPWPGWQKFLFRFVFILFLFLFDPVDWFVGLLQWETPVYNAYDNTRARIVRWANDHFFHIRPVLVMPSSSGDTSFSWALLCCVICVTSIGAVVWSVADRRRPAYRQLGYWFRTYLRYYLILTAFIYGFAKITLDQMGTLSLSDLATPVGSLSPMRICWYFIAASPPYQIFSGISEVLVGVLLLNRRTVTLGLLTGLAVFSNVMALNFAYDIQVKIFSTELVLCCIILLFRDYERLMDFLVLNKTASRSDLYDPVSQHTGLRISRIILKTVFIYFAIVVPLWPIIKTHAHEKTGAVPVAIHPGIYDITRFTRNGDSAAGTNKQWTKIILDKGGRGSIWGDSTIFKYRYGRSLFLYSADTVLPHTIKLKVPHTDNPGDGKDSMMLQYEIISESRIRCRVITGADSLRFEGEREKVQYPLQEWQFHWLSEYTN